MNAGAYGREVADILVEAILVRRDGRVETWPAERFGYTYRHSELPEGAVVVEALFQGVPGERAVIGAEMDRIAAEGRVCVLELEIDGARAVQDEVDRSVTLFIAADVPELERRLRARATESSGEIEDRIALARHQLEQAYRFRYMVRNDDVERATDALSALVERELAAAGTMAGS